MEILSVVSFTEKGGKTTLKIQWEAHSATEEERTAFEEGRDSMQQGWTGTLDRLADCLAKI